MRVQAGALSLLAACFFVSGLLRAGEVVGALPAVGATRTEESSAGAAPARMSAAGIVGLAEELRRQRAELGRREAELTEREQLLEAVEERVRDRLAELERARDELARTASLVERGAERDVERLAEIYRRMKPKEAARIFDAMAPEFAAGFLGEIGSDGAAAILASMKPEKAYAASVLLAGRNVDKP